MIKFDVITDVELLKKKKKKCSTRNWIHQNLTIMTNAYISVQYFTHTLKCRHELLCQDHSGVDHEVNTKIETFRQSSVSFFWGNKSKTVNGRLQDTVEHIIYNLGKQKIILKNVLSS